MKNLKKMFAKMQKEMLQIIAKKENQRIKFTDIIMDKNFGRIKH